MRPMMSWMLRRAWEEVAAGGGAARIMSPLPSAPRPPGPHALVGSTGRFGRDSPHCRDPWASSRDGLWQGSLSAALRGPWAAGEWQTPLPPPPPPSRRLVCARVCVCAGGGAVSPLSPETPASSEPGSSGWAPSQLSPRKDGSPLIHPNQEVLETSAPPKDLQCPRSLFSLSSPQKPFVISLWIHCLFALLITSIPTRILSASP